MQEWKWDGEVRFDGDEDTDAEEEESGPVDVCE